MIWCGGILLLPVLALANFTQGPSLLLDSEWESWKTVYEKDYNSQGEEQSRRSIWEKNMQLIDAHNHEYKRGIHSYQLGMNSLGDMTSEEVAMKMTGLRVPRFRKSNSTFLPDGDLRKLPRSIDYRKKGYVTPVRHQGSCGSCWAFSAAGALEGLMKKKTGKLVSLSPQNLVDCVNQSGCIGGFMTDAFKYISTNKGIDSEKAYPYVAKDQACAYYASGKAAMCRWYKEVESGNERELRVAVGRVGPVSAAVSSLLDTFRFYKRGVYNDPRCSADDIDHAVLVVGYSFTCWGKKYWIIKNSWGTDWGMKGYMRLARNLNNICGIATMASYPII
ncbi:cathepsin K-like [Brienomyrus brachyistius]|uniref:cathepsin K-like n=1 Tax=Brienomyrus brachyistius TaxID=42636 RepID=UPI0020B44240|nr:cathepsin K-like [Brienomyrus brachyistius]